MLNMVDAERFNEFITLFLRNSPDAICLVNQVGEVLYVNPSYEKLYGWTKDDLIEQKHSDIPTELIETETEVFREWSKNGTEITGFETYRLRKYGDIISVTISITPIKDKADQIIAYVCTSRDITRRKMSEMNYHQLFNKSDDAIFLYEIDREGTATNFIDVNYTACQKLGYTKDELLSMNLEGIVDQDYLGIGNKTFELTLQETARFEWAMIMKSQTKIPVEISIKTFTLNKRKIVLTVVRDLTERKRTDEFLQQSESLTVLGELSAGIAHEIRNPLTSIRGFVQLMYAGSSLYKSFHDLIISEVDRINGIVGELLLMAKPKVLEFESKNIVSLVNQVVDLLNAQAHLSENEIRIKTDSDCLYIECIENKLKQVFINILKNAIEASPKGEEIVVQVKKEGFNVIVQVMDRGCGMSTGLLTTIGKPFFTTKSQGTGLGITISQKIIADHAGTIEYISEEKKGTTVVMTFPLG
ncbi:MAG TPA: PAS domain S-box protein [Bacillota bacterium]|nr:PAS domain S-box protein [Bacillota bacterium]